MKKILALAVLLAILATTAASAAEIDLSGMTFEELRALQTQLNQEIVSRPEWKEVTVPMGAWIVGVDIPAGDYSVRLVRPKGAANIAVWRTEVNDHSGHGLIYNITLMNDRQEYGRMTLQEGNIVEIGGPVIFAPPVTLGF